MLLARGQAFERQHGISAPAAEPDAKPATLAGRLRAISTPAPTPPDARHVALAREAEPHLAKAEELLRRYRTARAALQEPITTYASVDVAQAGRAIPLQTVPGLDYSPVHFGLHQLVGATREASGIINSTTTETFDSIVRAVRRLAAGEIKGHHDDQR